MKITQKLYIQAIKYTYEAEFSIKVSCVKFTSDDIKVVIDIDETEIELSVIDFKQDDFDSAYVEQLREIKQKLMADTEVKLNSLDEQIDSLLAIENKQ